MVTIARGLGRFFDVNPVVTPVDLQTAQTGFPVSMKGAESVAFVLFSAVGTAGDDPIITLREATDGSGTGEQDLAAITSFWYKEGATALDGSQTWTKVTQTAAATLDTDGNADAENASMVIFEVRADQLSDTFTHVTIDVADTGTNAQLGCAFAIVSGLKVQRAPENLAALQ